MVTEDIPEMLGVQMSYEEKKEDVNTQPAIDLERIYSMHIPD